MKIQTMSIVVGSNACNAACPFCISKITGKANIPENINWHNFHIACQLAEISGVTTCLLTGKGEPTLDPNTITIYLEMLAKYRIPFKELQTNGIEIDMNVKALKHLGPGEDRWSITRTIEVNALNYWHELGLTTVCLSIVSPNSLENRLIYQPGRELGFMDVPGTIYKIHQAGLMTRVSCMLLKGYVDSVEKLKDLIEFCRKNEVKQLTVRPIDAPAGLENDRTKWVKEHTVDCVSLGMIKDYITTYGTPILELAHGGIIYDIGGQNVCWGNCLTTNKSAEDMRQIIFYPDGTISYDWKYKGAVLL